MGIYITIAVFLGVNTFLSFCKGIPKKYLYWFSLLLLIIVASFRDLDVGTDTQQYFYNYKYIVEFKDRASFSGSQIIFYYYTLLCHYILTYDLFMIVSYGIAFGGVGWLIWKCSPYKILSLTLYFLLFYLASLNVMRQYISMGIYAVGLSYLFHDMKKEYLIYTLVAGCIHFSALLMIPLVFIRAFQIPKITTVILVAASFYIGIFLNIMQPVVQVFEIFSFLSDNVSGYIGNWGSEEGRNILSNAIINMAFLLTYCLSNNIKSKAISLWFIFIIASNLLGAAGQANRIFLYLLLGAIIAVPEVLFQIRRNYGKRIVLFGFIFMYTVGFWMTQLVTGVNEVIPYKFR